jgi:hypothetical protein
VLDECIGTTEFELKSKKKNKKISSDWAKIGFCFIVTSLINMTQLNQSKYHMEGENYGFMSWYDVYHAEIQKLFF